MQTAGRCVVREKSVSFANFHNIIPAKLVKMILGCTGMAYNLKASAQTAVTLQIQLFTVIVIQIFGGFVYTVGVICITFIVYLKLNPEEAVFVAVTEKYRTRLI